MNDYNPRVDGYWDAANGCYTCANCLGVLGSVGCCKAKWRKELEQEVGAIVAGPQPAVAQKEGSG